VPIYEYQCISCEHKFEKIQKVSDNPLVTCPSCDEDSLRKLVSAASFRLKGTGWYETDFKKKPEKDQDKTKKETTAKDDKSSNKEKPESKSSDTDTKPKKETSNSSGQKAD